MGENMSNYHMSLMADLLNDRENRSAKRSVSKLNIGELQAELEARSCSRVGSEAALRDRLLRAIMREDLCQIERVPWFEWDLEGTENIGFESKVEFLQTKKKKRGKGKAKSVVVEPTRVSRGTQTESSDEERGPRKQTVVVQVHQPALPVPVSSTAVTPSVTTAPVTTYSFTPIVAHSALGKPYSPGEGGISSTAYMPRLSINADFQQYLRQFPREIEYFSAERVRKIRAAVPETAYEQMPAITPVRPTLQPSKKAERKWYTPMQDFDLIERASQSSRAEDNASHSGTVSDVPRARSDEAVKSGRESDTRGRGKDVTRVKNAMAELERTLNEVELSQADSDAENTSSDSAPSWNKNSRSYGSGEVRAEELLERVEPKGRSSIHKRKAKASSVIDIIESSESESEFETVTRRRKPRTALKRNSRLPRYGNERVPSRDIYVCAASRDNYAQPVSCSSAAPAAQLRGVARPASGGHVAPRVSRGEAPMDLRDKTPKISRANITQPTSRDADVNTAGSNEPNVNVPVIINDNDNLARLADGHKERAVRLFQSWGLKFTGEDKNEDPDEFWERLEECREGSTIPDRGILSAIPCIFSKRAGRWYRTIKADLYNWADFKRAFKNQFTKEFDREDLLDDLKRRTQAKGEKIASFITSIRYIVGHFVDPPSEKSIFETAWRNLLPEYRRAMMDKVVENLDDLERFGLIWERQKDLDRRYAPPPPAENFHLAGAGYSGATGRSKVAAVQEITESADEVAAASQVGKAKSKLKKGNKNVEKADGRAAKSVEATTVGPTQPIATKPIETRTYANVAQAAPPSGAWNNAPGVQLQARWSGGRDHALAYARPGQASGAAYRQPQRYARNEPARDARMMPFRGPQPDPSKQLRYAPQSQMAQGNNGERNGFIGACFTCQAVGHRASECPEIICFICHQKGHVARDCKERVPARASSRESCESCGAWNTNFKTCPAPKCTSLRALLGNAQCGEQRS